MNLEAKVDTPKAQIGLMTTNVSKEGGDGKFAQMLEGMGLTKGKDDPALLALVSQEAESSENGTTNLKNILSLTKGDSDGEAIELKDLKAILSELSSEEQRDFKALNPQLTKTLDVAQVKELIANAKEYLKDKLQQIMGKDFKQEDMPKTLKGLLSKAKEMGIDIKKINVEHIPAKGAKVEEKINIFDTKEESNIKEIPKDLTKTTNVKQEVALQQNNSSEKVILKQENAVEKTPLAQILTDKKVETKKGDKVETVISKEENIKTDKKDVQTTKIDLKQENVKDIKVDVKAQKVEVKPQESSDLELETNEEQKLAEPLNEKVKAKATLVNLLNPDKKVASELLKEEVKVDVKADVKVDIAPKTSILNTLNKSSDIKLTPTETKTFLGGLSSSLKEAADNYKPPFTKITMKLNPEKLGSVEVTLIQRGDNVVIKLNANSNALNILSQNVGDLRAQLNASGLGNATLNMGTTQQSSDSSSSNSSNSNQLSQNQQGSQEQKQQNQQHPNQKHLLEVYENLDLAENENVENLEIVLPKYI